MADALVEQGRTSRFFCHRCNIEFEDVLQDYTCPYCASGFIELLENVAEGQAVSSEDFSDADMSNIDDMNNWEDLDDLPQSATPLLNDLAFFISGGGLRNSLGRRPTLLEDLVLMLSGARPGGGAIALGPPFVFIGAPGDYVLGGEGLDAVVTQLLGQLENAGPPPMSTEQLATLPDENVSSEQAATNTTCSICWENFTEGESVSRLECEHIFHSACIRPWLQLHATCPICRRSLLPDAPQPPPAQPTAQLPRRSALSRVVLRRFPRLQATRPQILTRNSLGDMSSSSSGSTSTTSSVTAGGVWAPRSTTNSTGSNSSTSLNSSNDRERQYNMDIDYD